MAAFTPIGVDSQVRGLSGFLRDLGKMDSSIQKTGKRTESVGKQFTGLGSKVLGVGATMAKVAAGAVVGLGAAVAGLGVVSVKTAISVESAFAGVIKTTDGLVDSAGELTAVGAEIRQGFRDLAKEVPVAVEELLGIGEIAGQLGVGKEALIDFTRTVADLGVATNLTTEEAAFNLARIANIFGVETEDMGENSQRLGSTIVDLGNNFATTERDITSFAERIAGAGKIAGLTQADILAIGTAMSSVGVQAEAGGTAVQKVLLAMNEATVGATTGFVDNSKAIDKNQDKLLDLNAQLVKLEAQTGLSGQALFDQFEAFKAAGGAAADFGRELGDTRRAQLFKTTRAIQDLSAETDLLRENQGRPITAEGLETFARTAGLTAAEFKELWQEDASKAFELFVLGLGEQGDAAIGTLEELGLTDQRLVRSFLSLAGAGDLLTETLALGEEAWAENTALTEEAEKRYRTTESQLLLLKNQLRDVAITIGDALLPFLNQLVQAARPIIEELGKRLPAAIDAVIAKIKELVGAFQAGGVAGLAGALGFSDETISLIQGIGQRIVDAIQFVQENWEAFKGALIGIGAVLAAAGIAAAIVGIAGAIAALFNPITLIIIAAAALGAAWQTNFLGIRDTLTAFWENTAQPIFEQLVAWLQTNIPIAIQTLSSFWETTLLPAMTTAWNFIQTSVIPALSELWTWLQTSIPIAIQTLSSFWETTLLPAIQQVSDFFIDTLIPIISQVVTWLSENLPLAGGEASSFFTETLIPAIEMLAEIFAPTIERLIAGFQGFLEALAPIGPKFQEFLPVLAEIAEFIGTIVIGAILLLGETVAFVLPTIGELFTNAVSTAMGVITGLVDFLGGAIQMIKGLFTGDMEEARAGAERVLGGLLGIFTSVFDGILGVIEPVIGLIGDLLEKLGILQGLDLGNIQLPEGLKAPFEGVGEAATGAIDQVNSFANSLGNIKLPSFLEPGSPTPFEMGLRGIATVLAEVIPAALQSFSAQALAVFTQVDLLVKQLDASLTQIWEVTLPQLQITTQVTADSMVVAFNQVSEAVSRLNTLLGQTLSLLQAIAAAAEAAAKAMTEGFDAAAESISGDLIEALEELRDILEDVKTEAEAAASAVNDIGRGTPTAGAGVGPGFQRGANFTVPPGFPGDSFRMGVTTGERVIVIPPGDPAPAGVGGETNFIMNINSLASPTAVIQQFEVMQALVS